MKSVLKGLLGVILGLCLVAVGVVVSPMVAGFWAVNAIVNSEPVSRETETADTRVIHAISRTEQVALLSLGIQGIEKKTEKTSFFGVDIPGSERALFLQYTFRAKLGINGEEVKVEQTGENEFTVSVPAFIVIGHDDVTFSLAAEDNGVLSWVTPEIDTIEMTNEILSDGARQEYIESNEDLLREQAEAFYRGIVHGIDPTVDLKFEFGPRSSQ